MTAEFLFQTLVTLFGIVFGTIWGFAPFVLACVVYHYVDKSTKNNLAPWACALGTMVLCGYLNVVYFY